MEATDCIYGGYYSAGTPQMGQEKKAGGGDHFIVEDLLDFSNEEEDSGANNGDDAAFEAAEGNSSADSSTITAVESYKTSGGDQQFSGEKLTCRSVATDATGDLCEPSDDLAELEWLSNFVEESFSSEDHQKLQLISGVKAGSGEIGSSSETRGGDGKLTTIQHQHPAPFYLPEASTVPGKARSKRSRAAPCNWSSRLLVLSPTAATSSSNSDPVLLNPNLVRKSPKPAKKREAGPAAGLMAAPDGRKCLHCSTDKTPQWRTGPMGAKTLCNACGVRYKSGRLVPEYRPAASPTFVLSQHSNSHRKVLELRRQKELQQHQTPPPSFLHAGAPIFDAGTMGPVAGADDFLIHHHLGPDFRQLI